MMLTDRERNHLLALRIAADWVRQAYRKEFDAPPLFDAIKALEVALLQPERFIRDYIGDGKAQEEGGRDACTA